VSLNVWPRSSRAFRSLRTIHRVAVLVPWEGEIVLAVAVVRILDFITTSHSCGVQAAKQKGQNR